MNPISILLHPKNIILTLAAILGIWLVYWDVADFATTGFNTGVWDWTIISNGLPSILVGIIILVFISWYWGRRVL